MGIDRKAYSTFWIYILESKGIFYFVLMGILVTCCFLGLTPFIKNYPKNSWWRWIYLFGGMYLLFEVFAIGSSLEA